MKAIQAAWVTGFAGLAVATLLPPPLGLVVQCVAVLLVLVAWCGAIFRAARAGNMVWLFLVAFLPGITMWLFLFGRHGRQRKQSVPLAPHLARRMVVFPPLAVRQAEEVIDDAEDRYPEW